MALKEDKMVREDLERIGEKRTLLNNILSRKVGHILRRNYLFRDVIEGQIMKVKIVGRRNTQLLENLRKKREEAEYRKR